MFNPLIIKLNRSTCYYRIIASVHLLAILGLLSTGFPVFTLVILLGLVLVSWFMQCRFPINAQIESLRLAEEGSRVQLGIKEGRWIDVARPSALFFTPFMILIAIRPRAPIHRQWLVILPDMVSRESWRRLQVFVRWSRLVTDADTTS